MFLTLLFIMVDFFRFVSGSTWWNSDLIKLLVSNVHVIHILIRTRACARAHTHTHSDIFSTNFFLDVSHHFECDIKIVNFFFFFNEYKVSWYEEANYRSNERFYFWFCWYQLLSDKHRIERFVKGFMRKKKISKIEI